MPRTRIDTTIIGNAGEYYVMCQLLRRGWIAALAPTGVPNMDIIVTDKDSQKLCSISVKTRRDIGSDRGWHMSEKHERIAAADLFYCFINFGKNERDSAKCYVVPSEIVANALIVSHKAWHRQPGSRGQELNAKTDMRRLLPDYSHHARPALQQNEPEIYHQVVTQYGPGLLDQYLERWDKLGLPRGSAF